MFEEVKQFLKDNSYRLDNGCIQWKLLDSDGRTSINGYNIAKKYGYNYAHRLAYSVYKDSDLRETPEIRLFHSCKNKGCINVAHLFEYENKNINKCTNTEHQYHYYNGGEYIFYLKATRKKVLLDKKQYIVEKGRVFRISYLEPFDEILKEECRNLGVLKIGEVLC